MSICVQDFVETHVSPLLDFQDCTQSTVLVIDPMPAAMLRLARQVFASENYGIDAVCTSAAAMDYISNDPPDLILLDPQLPDQCGYELHREIRRAAPQIPVIFVSNARTADAPISAMKQGAYDYLIKPLDGRQLLRVVRDALEIARKLPSLKLATEISSEPETMGILAGICPVMHDVYKSIGLVASQDVNVLITGESGTGKELVARAVHQHSSRANQPFLALNCAAIPENLLESELFGHEKGAFSGADRRRIGKFEQYDGGTILLDEIGDMPLNLQAKILRLLQEQTFERIGGNQTIRTNVRLIASTHRDLKTWANQEKFRADLYYRLSVFTIHLPPLRERIEDLPMLADYFTRQYSRELGRDVKEIHPQAMQILNQYKWPGNIRELQSVLKQALLHSTGNVLLPNFLPPLQQAALEATQNNPREFRDLDLDDFLIKRLRPDASDLYAEFQREFDRRSLSKVLSFTGGNQHMASRLLGIARQTLRLKLRECGLHVKQLVESTKC